MRMRCCTGTAYLPGLDCTDDRVSIFLGGQLGLMDEGA
jgi:hypothetical protein